VLVLPHGSWVRVMNLGFASTPSDVQKWLEERGIYLPIEQISKGSNTTTATLCFQNKDIADLVRWIMENATFGDRAPEIEASPPPRGI
jgi:hypothetical protein